MIWLGIVLALLRHTRSLKRQQRLTAQIIRAYRGGIRP